MTAMPDDADASLPERLRSVVATACDAAATIEALEAQLVWRDMRIAALERPRAILAPVVCTAAVVQDGSGRVLLLRRGAACSWPGHWSLPGGRVEPGESLVECCRRELREETGLEAATFTFDAVTDAGGMVGIVFRTGGVTGSPINAEPEKHGAITWCSRGEFPTPLMPGVVQWLEASAGAAGRDRAEVTAMKRELARLRATVAAMALEHEGIDS